MVTEKTNVITYECTTKIIKMMAIKKKRRRKFPPRVRLMTEEEYFEQGTIETKKALEGLRDFTRSPECNAWKTMSKLKNPLRYVS